MNRNTIMAAFFALVCLGGQSALAKSGYDLFQKGLVQERTRGDLDEAIRLYKQIVTDHKDDRTLVAKALLQMGGCYEKLGQAEAQKAYQRVIEEYPGQKQEVAIAKERIAEISNALKEAAQQPTFRRIKIASYPQNGVLSPDGNKLAFMSDDAVWLVPLHGEVDPDIAGEPVRLAEVPGIWEASGMMAWSADGKWIAVYSGDPSGSDEGSVVSILPVAGGKPRVVQLPKQGGFLYSHHLSLSPDGQILAFSALELGKSSSGGYDRRIYTIRAPEGEPKQISSDWARLPSFSPDGQFIAYVGYRQQEAGKNDTGSARVDGDLCVVPSAGGTPVRLATVDGRLRGPVWSPDGKYIAAHHEPLAGSPSDEIWVYPLSPDVSSAGEPTKIVLPRASYHILAGWTPGGELGAFIESETHTAIYTVAASGGRAVQVTPEGGGPYYPRWSPDGERIYFRWFFGESDRDRLRDWLSGHEATAYVPAGGGDPVEIPSMELEQELGLVIPGGGLRISPDGKRIVISAVEMPWDPKKGLDIWTVPVDGGAPTRLTSDTSREEHPCWSPNGDQIAFVDWHAKSEDEGFKAICVAPVEGGEIRQISSESDSVAGGAIAFSPDGERIAFFSGDSIKTIPVEGGEPEVLVAKVRSDRHSQLAYSPGGLKIAHNATGKIWITRLDGGEPEELQTGLPEGARLSDLDWSPDSEKIVFMASIGGESDFWLIENFLPAIEPKVKAVRQVWDYATMGGRGNMGRPSPDGRYLLYADVNSINICALEFDTKKMHFITTEDVPSTLSDNPSREPIEFHWGASIWSPDGKKVAYSWLKFKGVFVFKDAWDQKRNLKDSFKELRITGLDGSNTKILYSDDNLAGAKPLDWSSDGKTILAEFIGKDDTRRLVTVSVADGSVRVLKVFDKLPRRDGFRIGDLFSPNGRYVVFDSPQKDSL